MISALQDLGMKVVATGTKKSTEEDKARIRELMGDDVKMLDEGNPRAVAHGGGIPRRHPHAGGRKYVHRAQGAHPLDINQEREFGYAGYDGMRNWCASCA